MEELGISSITSRSPQAKGRIKRLWGTFQDRLVSELRLAGGRTLEEANRILWDFLLRYNQRFAVPAAQAGTAYRQPEEEFIPGEVFCFKYYRTVGTDNVARFGGHRLQIMPSNGRLSYARARVEVHERLDGSLAVYYQGRCLATKPAPPEAPVLRVRNTARVILGTTDLGKPAAPAIIVKKPLKPKTTHYTKPRPDHPWRRPFKVHLDRG
jgi:hypothetical protein